MRFGGKLSFRKTLIFCTFGIAIGLCIGTVFKNYKAIELVKRCSLKPSQEAGALQIIGMNPSETVYNSQKSLVFIGVMTAKNFLQGRAKAVYDTWGKDFSGYLAFFSSEDSKSETLPVIALKNVDDRYPPQKKSFMMLFYMYEHFIDKFEWFIRADDDVYIDTKKLEYFLRSIDSSKPQFIGQAGKGNSEEFGLLSLEFDENFCMGGPGVILSRETLRRVAPHIPTCLKNLYSTHEDVELGRCVQKFAGIPCTWNYEMQNILRHNSSGKQAFAGNLKRKEIHSAITLHPVKQSPLMYRLHSFMQGLQAEDLRQEALLLHRDIKNMKSLLQISSEKNLASLVPLFPEKNLNPSLFEDHDVLGANPDLNKLIPNNTSEILDWSFLARSIYSVDSSNPKRKIDSTTKESLEDAITEVMENINNFSRQRGRVIEFRELLYGYSRLNPLHGQDLILDLLLIYKKYRGKKMTVPVRRHLYVQRSFTGVHIREIDLDFQGNGSLDNSKNQGPMQLLSSQVKNIFDTGFERISNSFTLTGSKESKFMNDITKIVFVLSIQGRYSTYKRFIENYEKIAIRSDSHCDLLVVLFGDRHSVSDHLDLLNELRKNHLSQRINHIILNQSFSRGVALDTATKSAFIQNDEIIFFIDVDMKFDQSSIDRVRFHTIQAKQVYLPIVFSEYDDYKGAVQMEKVVSNENGYFRQFGFGICAIYKSDIMDPLINGFNTDIAGWGLEDVKFLEKIIKAANEQPFVQLNSSDPTINSTSVTSPGKRLSVFRSPDPSLIHIFHEIVCDRTLESDQYIMCLGTKANTLGTTDFMEKTFLSNVENIKFISELNVKNRI